MASIKLKVITPEKVVIELETYQATLPVEGGEVTILPNHMPYIGAIQAGEIILRKEASGEEISLATSGGFVEFHENTLVVLADTAERAEEIDLARAEEARKRAEELKKETVHMGEEEYARTAALLEKELTRVKVARKHHTRRGISLGNGGF
ncbi:MAG: ATP synthase F1 subunit epsilon [Candidatus Moranbacteria bacterium RIFCSPLOWO2_02_FULL_48_19]|nr:MAG: ATP synthase F1 subunit epsilon [Candidatus Moranbacteria bacterium RIFCSPLOWO2_02_FULL_48_19]OGI29910.1 MAG: ATP synthase F1 subunit epsilon [Candidatus Moranbacteria bacterium RIFCSPLOWO2_12_FULL_48_12]